MLDLISNVYRRDHRQSHSFSSPLGITIYQWSSFLDLYYLFFYYSTIMKVLSFASLVRCIDLATALLLPRDVSHSTTFPSLRARRGSCANTATSRGCWGNYRIDSNFYEESPVTGVTREYWLNVQNTTLAPDVSSRSHP